LEHGGPPWATWWGRPTPPCIGRHGNTCATSPIHGSGQETHPQFFSIVDFKSVQDEGLKMSITWIVDSPCLCRCSNGQSGFIPTLYYTPGATTPKEEGCSNGQSGFIPTLYYTPGATTPKEEGPLHSGPSPDVKGRCPMPHFHSTASPSDTCKKAHLGSTWYIG
jgi:hypothetical protein